MRSGNCKMPARPAPGHAVRGDQGSGVTEAAGRDGKRGQFHSVPGPQDKAHRWSDSFCWIMSTFLGACSVPGKCEPSCVLS